MASVAIPDAGSFCDDELYDYHGIEHPKAIAVHCPHCRSKVYPFLSKSLVKLSRTFDWVGTEYKIWYNQWQVRCSRCRKDYTFKTYTDG